MKRIFKVGLELEGGWNKSVPSEIYSDGSVSVDASTIGEIASLPLFSKEVEKFLQKNYPQVVNKTCGFHIHFSMKNLYDYGRLMERPFYDFFLAHVSTWAEGMKKIFPRENWENFYTRLHGDNNYCMRKFYPLTQKYLTEKRSERYTHLNFCFSFHGTIECRLFPMWRSKKLARETVKFLCETVENYLLIAPREIRGIKAEILVEEEPTLIKNEIFEIEEENSSAGGGHNVCNFNL